MRPVCVLVQHAAHNYIDGFFPDEAELEPPSERIRDVDNRIRAVDKAHEGWFSSRSDE
jgi:hypothetical protein